MVVDECIELGVHRCRWRLETTTTADANQLLVQTVLLGTGLSVLHEVRDVLGLSLLKRMLLYAS